MKLKLPADKVTNVLGMIGALLIVQQTYMPDLLPREYSATILATIVSVFGVASNKKTITVTLNGKKEEKDIPQTLEEMEQKIEELVVHIEELREQQTSLKDICGRKDECRME